MPPLKPKPMLRFEKRLKRYYGILRVKGIKQSAPTPSNLINGTRLILGLVRTRLKKPFLNYLLENWRIFNLHRSR